MSAMNNFAKLAYISEINIQCTYALNAIQHAINALNESWELGPEETQPYYNEVFRNIHSFLNHAGNISKIFWPVRTRVAATKVRGEMLRKEFDLEDDSVLNRRTLRDHLEHYDERLDVINQEGLSGFMPDAVMTLEQLSERGFPIESVMRLLDYQSMTFYFRGADFALSPLFDIIDSIHQESNTYLSQKWIGEGGEPLTATYTKE
jgi:hypothetical protein